MVIAFGEDPRRELGESELLLAMVQPLMHDFKTVSPVLITFSFLKEPNGPCSNSLPNNLVLHDTPADTPG